MSARIATWLQRASPGAFSVYAILAAFTAYFCMYAFRKPFAAEEWEGLFVGPIKLKIALLMSQLVGYTLSKYLGVKFVSELDPRRRATGLVALIAGAEVALLAFGLLPATGQLVALFFNGLCLGAVWGLVFGFLEGRKTSEILGAGLSCSYIVASGAVKSVGAWLVAAGVTPSWMPFVTGLLFLTPFLVAVYLLRLLPRPTPQDEAARTAREPMVGRQRIAFLRRFAFGLLSLSILYMLLTAYRDFRDNFAPEIWRGLGYGGKPEIFTLSEIPVAFAVMVALALIYRVRNNRRALLLVHALMAFGTVLIGGATLLYDAGAIGGFTWMVAIGVGLYLGYVPYGCVLFDRLIAATGTVGTAVFMIYVTDALGYTGSVTVMLIKNFTDVQVSWLAFFRGFSYVTAAACTAAFALSAWYFARRTKRDQNLAS